MLLLPSACIAFDGIRSSTRFFHPLTDAVMRTAVGQVALSVSQPSTHPLLPPMIYCRCYTYNS